MASISLSTHLEFSKVELGKKSTVHLLVNLKAQPFVPKDRKPLSISAVIDCSGSMAGTKIEYAKKTLRELAGHMTEEDTLTISAFSDDIWQVLGETRMSQSGREKAKKEIENLHIVANTNLSGATIEGWGRIKNASSPVARVILFTDGLPTAGITDRNQIIQIAGKRSNEKASLTTMGYGQDCDRELLGSMAKAGLGNFYFVNTPDECLSIFGTELGGLLSCVAQQIRVLIDTEKDVKVLEVLNDFDVDADDKDGRWANVSVGDAYADEVRRVLVKLELPPVGYTLGARPIHVATVKSEFFDVLANEGRWEESKVKVEFVPAPEVQKDPDILVKEEIAIQAAAKAQEEARKLADAHDWKGAQALVCLAMSSLKDVGTVTADCYAQDLGENVLEALKGEAEYRSSGGAHYMFSNRAGYSKGRASNKNQIKLMGTPMQKSATKSFEEGVADPVMPVPSGTVPMIQNTPPVPPAKDTAISKKKRR